MHPSCLTQPIGGDKAFGRPPEHFQYLPLPAKCAIEYLDAQGYGNRTIEKLNLYLDHYLKVTALECDEYTRYSCHYIAIKRFSLSGDDIKGNLYWPETTSP